MSDRITAYCVALSEKTELNLLNMADTTAGQSMHGFGTEFNQFDEIIDIKFCQGTIGFSIDDFVAMFSPSLPTHVKIDVDGHRSRHSARWSKHTLGTLSQVDDH